MRQRRISPQKVAEEFISANEDRQGWFSMKLTEFKGKLILYFIFCLLRTWRKGKLLPYIKTHDQLVGLNM